MKKIIIFITLFCLVSCKKEGSLQEYFVKNAEKKEFLTLDVSSSVLNINEKKLSDAEKIALESFDKVNILAYKIDDKNNTEYNKEIAEVKEILKDTTFQPLIKLSGDKQSASIMLVGNEKEIDELVLFGNQKNLGFTVLRILGNDMKPENAMHLFSILQKSDIKMDQLKPILNFLNKKK